MKTLNFLTAAFTVLVISTATAQEIVNIPDPGLQAAIRVALEKSVGDITVDDMESLTELDANIRSRGFPDAPLIYSQEGIQFAKNLTALDLSGTISSRIYLHPNIEITDFSPLSGLLACSNWICH